jgi:hypothetical protein
VCYNENRCATHLSIVSHPLPPTAICATSASVVALTTPELRVKGLLAAQKIAVQQQQASFFLYLYNRLAARIIE